jgi:hypothetical protein
MIPEDEIDDLLEGQMADMAELTAAGHRSETRIGATQALALLGIWDELRRPNHPAVTNNPPFPPFKRGVGVFDPQPRREDDLEKDLKPGLTD